MLGRNIHIGIGKETTRGTVASTISYLPKTSASFDSKVEKANNEASIGVLQDSYESNVVKEHAEGEVEQNLQMNAVSFLLLAAFGAVTSATDSAGAYKHDFTVAQNNSHPSMTIVVADDVQDYAYTNAMLDTLELSASANQYINLKTSWKARKGATTSATPTYSSNDLTFLAKNMTVKMANDEAGLSGATNICVETFSLNIQKNLQEEVCL
ncbi:MAG: hypothetical protein EKK61_04165 [Rickettsiales bacterium]|nr:MAG: hypothetical protein EKK61_04165 [Rickettsiales bacterium]